MNKSVKKMYEQDRSFDFFEYPTQAGRKFTKRRCHRRLRRGLRVEARKEANNES